MNKFFTIMAAVAALAMTVQSCNKKSTQTPDPDTPTLTVNPNTNPITFTAAASGESHAYTVSTNQASWDAVSDKTWCVVTKSETGFTVTAQANTSENAREEATITVTAGEATAVTIKANQQGADPIAPLLSVSPENYDLTFTASAADESHAYTVSTNQSSWDAVSDKTWCVVTKSETGFTVTAQENTSEDAREEATITVTAGEATAVTIKANQPGQIPSGPKRTIYVAGRSHNANNTPVATLWKVDEKSGTVTQTILSENGWSSATCIATYNGEVYLGGSDYIASKSVPTIWKKDGSTVSLENPNKSHINAMYIDGQGTLYAAASASNGIALWKNGVAQTSVGSGDTTVKAISVINGKLHILGHQFISSTSSYIYFIDGVAKTLPTDTEGISSLSGITTDSSGNIYICGDLSNGPGSGVTPAYWKNDVLQKKVYNGSARSIQVIGSDVYMSIGYSIYKNGESWDTWEDRFNMNDFTILDGKIYGAGTPNTPIRAKVRMGDRVIQLCDTQSEAYGLCVVTEQP